MPTSIAPTSPPPTMDFGSDLPRIACPHCRSDRVVRVGVPVGDPHISCLRCWGRSTVEEASRTKPLNADCGSTFPPGVQRMGTPEYAKSRSTGRHCASSYRRMRDPKIADRLDRALTKLCKLDRYITQLEVCQLAGFTSRAYLQYEAYQDLNDRLKAHNKGRSSGLAVKRSRSVVQIDLKTGKAIATFKSLIEAGKTVGADHANISSCCRLKVQTAAGFAWRYADQWSEAEGRRIAKQHSKTQKTMRRRLRLEPEQPIDPQITTPWSRYVAIEHIPTRCTFRTQKEAGKATGYTQATVSHHCQQPDGLFRYVVATEVRSPA